MLDPNIARSIHEDRERARRRLERSREHRLAGGRPALPGRGRSVRRSLGRSIVRLGEAIAAEPRQPVAFP